MADNTSGYFGSDSNEFVVYIGNIDIDSTEAELKDFLATIDILNWNVIRNQKKCFAFVTVSNRYEAQRTLNLFDGKTFMKRELSMRLCQNDIQKCNSSDSKNLGKNKSDNSTRGRKPYKQSLMKPQMNSGVVCEKSNHRSNWQNKEICRDGHPAKMFINRPWQFDDNMPPLEDIGYVSEETGPKSLRCLLGDSDSLTEHSHGAKKKNTWKKTIRLLIGNFPYGTKEIDLMRLFQFHNPLGAVIKNNDNTRRSTYGFVFFSTCFEMEKAVIQFDHSTYKGNVLLVASIETDGTSTKKHMPDKLRCTITSVPGEFERNENEVRSSSTKNTSIPSKCWANDIPEDFIVPEGNCEMGILSNIQSSSTRDWLNLEWKKGTTAFKDTDSCHDFCLGVYGLSVVYKNFNLETEIGNYPSDIVVVITWVINKHCFWAQVVSQEYNRCKKFMEIQSNLQVTAPKWNKVGRNGRCVAMYCDEWSRGWILKSFSRDTVQVFFVDFGNTSAINLDAVRSSPDSLWSLSPRARSFQIPDDFPGLPEKTENLSLALKILNYGTAANGYISQVKIK